MKPTRPSARRTFARALTLLSATALAGVASRSALAVPPPVREDPVQTPGRSLAGSDDASAVATNPANVAFLPAPEARWTWVSTGESSPRPDRGHAISFATPLFLHLATGLRIDLVRPQNLSMPFDANYTWLHWALAVRAHDAFAFGFSVNHASSDEPRLDGLTSYTLAASARPSPYLGVSVVGENLNAPTSETGAHIDYGVDVGVAVRPTGRREIELGLEARYLNDRYYEGAPLTGYRGQWVPRAVLGVDVPYVGRLRGDVQLSDPTTAGRHVYTATAGLEVGWGTSTYEGGGIFGSGVNGPAGNGTGFYAGLSVSGARSPGLPEPGYALKIRIEETPGARGHVKLLRRLWALARDPELRAVAIVLKAEPAESLARAEELGDAFRLLRANGKKVVCHMEDSGGRSLFACSQADRIAMNPAGGLRFAGLRSQYQYYGGLLEKLGVRAQFIRIGAHKSAPEQFMRTGPTEVAHADHIDLLREYEDVFLHDVGGGRKIPIDRLHETFAHGPFIAREAKEVGLVDSLAFDDEIGSVIDETVGSHVRLLDDPPPPAAPQRFGARRGIAVVYVEGDMVDGRSRDIPLVGTRLSGSYTVAKALKDAREDPLVSAVVLRVESPGGSSMAADVMWREAVLTAKKKPLVVSMGSTAASGGYYVAVAGQTVYANPLTVTGSIGIFYGKADVSQLMQKIGVSVETYKTTPRADAESMFRPFTPEEMTELEKKVAQFYDVFLDRVSTGRHMTKEQVDAVAQGRVWTGREAQARGLVDKLGGLRQALAEARRVANLPDDAPIEELPPPEASILGTLMKLAGAEEPSPGPGALLPPQLVSLARGLAPFTIFEGDRPLARMELVQVEDP